MDGLRFCGAPLACLFAINPLHPLHPRLEDALTPKTLPTHQPPGRFTLVAPRVPEDLAIWSGPLPSIESVADEAGADAAIYTDDLPQFIKARRQRSSSSAGGAPLLHTLEGMVPALAAAGVDVGGGEEGAGGVRVTFDFLRQALDRSRGRKTLAEVRGGGCGRVGW